MSTDKEPKAVKAVFHLGDDGVWCKRTGGADGESVPVSRKQVISTLGAKVNQLSDDERGDLFWPTMSAQVREKLAVTFNMTLEHVEREAAKRFAAGKNPLPWLCGMLSDIIDISEKAPEKTPLRPVLIFNREGKQVRLREIVFGLNAPVINVYGDGETLSLAA